MEISLSMKLDLSTQISNWIRNYAKACNKILIIGVSGGIDSAVTSILCANTFIKTCVISIPILQNENQLLRAREHCVYLEEKYSNVEYIEMDMTVPFLSLKTIFDRTHYNNELGLANTKSRLRMITLYQIASSLDGIVVGTGNKIEDFGVGFFTKYGDGGVDISPIGDLMKSEVRQLAKDLGVSQNIIDAKPTDGLWNDDRTDEDQLGITYDELEYAMCLDVLSLNENANLFNDEQQKILNVYRDHRNKNLHKMIAIPTFKKL